MVGRLRAKKMRRVFQAVLVDDALPPASGTCGNGVVEGFEACDDGNTADCDGCSADCTRLDAQCGDGIPECGEECDGTGCPSNEHCAGCRCVPDDATPQVCTEASSCSDRHTCSDAGDCRCIRSAEGDIRCGKAPSCDVPKCATSADCAPLGAGYFCDTPNSGCCSDGELTRCLSPCDAAPDPDNVPPTLSADVQHLLLEADKARRGLPADLDGDGAPGRGGRRRSRTARRRWRDLRGQRWRPERPEYLEPRRRGRAEETLVDRHGTSDGKSPRRRCAFAAGTAAGPGHDLGYRHQWRRDRWTAGRPPPTTPDAGTVARRASRSTPRTDGSVRRGVGHDGAARPRDAGRGEVRRQRRASRVVAVARVRSGCASGAAGDVSVPYNDDGSGGRCTKPRRPAHREGRRAARWTTGFKCLERTNDALAKRLLLDRARARRCTSAAGTPCAGTDATTIPWLRDTRASATARSTSTRTQLDGMSDRGAVRGDAARDAALGGRGAAGDTDRSRPGGPTARLRAGATAAGCISTRPRSLPPSGKAVGAERGLRALRGHRGGEGALRASRRRRWTSVCPELSTSVTPGWRATWQCADVPRRASRSSATGPRRRCSVRRSSAARPVRRATATRMSRARRAGAERCRAGKSRPNLP